MTNILVYGLVPEQIKTEFYVERITILDGEVIPYLSEEEIEQEIVDIFLHEDQPTIRVVDLIDFIRDELPLYGTNTIILRGKINDLVKKRREIEYKQIKSGGRGRRVHNQSSRERRRNNSSN